ncbi:MAG: MarR family winged helix-turn-helix transcriptional regulator [Candidatus Sphingomonas phytovorans]|nr:MarR family winged helix-turn-helix transcriptional regulator [Sphingomonas sp.]WEJ97844.1 MAG: MarR family winged helix-turn-helix transcriptional regulator [Sphingomonas sp.]
MALPALSDSPCACTSLRKAARAVSRVYDEALTGTGMTIAQFSVLRHTARCGDVSLSRLAETLVMDRTSLYRALAPLERQGWIEIVQAGRGRARIASLTVTGREAMERATLPWRAAQERLIGRLGADDWTRLETLLRDVVDVAGHD